MSVSGLTARALQKLQQTTHKTLTRSLDRHVKLAVTGFSGSGKTAFITALVKHLTTQATAQNLPFFEVVREQRLIACKQVPQSALDIPRFEYQHAVQHLLADPPSWPPSTQRINTLTLALKFRSAQGVRQHLSETHTVYLELIDYPGEWLMDLPMLNQDFASWSEQQLNRLKKTDYAQVSAPFLQQLEQFDACAAVNESELTTMAGLYAGVLKQLKAHTQLAQLQPGRMLIPGELDGAPILQFFPLPAPQNASEQSQYHHLEQRFEAYKKQVITPFYREHFCRFDRQLVLVDLLSALNDGHTTLTETQAALSDTLAMFRHGKSGLLGRLFRPSIDKVLFAANKCDSVALADQDKLTRLLHALLIPSENELKFSGVDIDTMAISSVKSTQPKQLTEQGKPLSCIYGKPVGESNYISYLPPIPPEHLPTEQQWPKQGYEFLSFEPYPAYQGQIEHIRLDHVLQFLLGDKLL
ncbi:YcjX family protein [Pseudoalteromonas rubra]|uniref:YcjX family protein n=1 Tax=Pseudoalteromonas rubra TaxID=43658 RepID=A0A5S3UTP6_9GAMM|nr:YcjX family protein [Pseudoalteromonas rubra]QPB82329.1 YcjX family protein [Pseudoalteromonas rubra]